MSCAGCGEALQHPQLPCAACGDPQGLFRTLQQALTAGVLALAAAFWVAVTPFSSPAGATPGAGLGELAPGEARVALAAAALVVLGLSSLVMAAVYGPRLLRRLRQALTRPPSPPAVKRRATVSQFLFAIFLALFVEALLGSALAPAPALQVGGEAHPIGSKLILDDAAAPPLRLSDAKVELTWRFASAHLEAPGKDAVELRVNGQPRSLSSESPLTLRPGDALEIQGLTATIAGPTWRDVALGTAVGKVLALLAVLLLIFALGGRELLAEVGLVRAGWLGEVGRGVASLLAFLPIYVCLVSLTLLAGTQLGVPVESHPLLKAIFSEGGVLVPLLIGGGAVLVAPIHEELLFRGLLQQGAQRAVGPLGALLVTGLSFGLIHQGFASLLPLSGLGLLFGVLRLTSPRGSLVSCIVAHGLFNALNFSLTVLIAAMAVMP